MPGGMGADLGAGSGAVSVGIIASQPSPAAREPQRLLITLHLAGAFRESMQHEPDEEVSWCDDVARA